MPFRLTVGDIQQIREDLLMLMNCMYDLRSEWYAKVAKRAEVALGDLLEVVRADDRKGDV